MKDVGCILNRDGTGNVVTLDEVMGNELVVLFVS